MRIADDIHVSRNLLRKELSLLKGPFFCTDFPITTTWHTTTSSWQWHRKRATWVAATCWPLPISCFLCPTNSLLKRGDNAIEGHQEKHFGNTHRVLFIICLNLATTKLCWMLVVAHTLYLGNYWLCLNRTLRPTLLMMTGLFGSCNVQGKDT